MYFLLCNSHDCASNKQRLMFRIYFIHLLKALRLLVGDTYLNVDTQRCDAYLRPGAFMGKYVFVNSFCNLKSNLSGVYFVFHNLVQ